eukprot:CAMPEP_0175938966 /NCGR_PEP_ID=MMETSP0108-20121206/22989_1 /TAXON_ID=195067 ORGANISM="Goniomonas pacifica, Strain CCMP1869" /NCGR_SAMPLE_ID=MMETSP0108 /ASSEMBLY_ACC=CAM_ASM_000204 /LENGTH=367 /DNA_ID=CAMNT_0017263275 /DNA_START=181 /DNA_END=1282 /DNA_ORIENTATION=-
MVALTAIALVFASFLILMFLLIITPWLREKTKAFFQPRTFRALVLGSAILTVVFTVAAFFTMLGIGRAFDKDKSVFCARVDDCGKPFRNADYVVDPNTGVLLHDSASPQGSWWLLLAALVLSLITLALAIIIFARYRKASDTFNITRNKNDDDWAEDEDDVVRADIVLQTSPRISPRNGRQVHPAQRLVVGQPFRLWAGGDTSRSVAIGPTPQWNRYPQPRPETSYRMMPRPGTSYSPQTFHPFGQPMFAPMQLPPTVMRSPPNLTNSPPTVTRGFNPQFSPFQPPNTPFTDASGYRRSSLWEGMSGMSPYVGPEPTLNTTAMTGITGGEPSYLGPEYYRNAPLNVIEITLETELAAGLEYNFGYRE